jgi:flagellar biosynthesis GTPase FlhF
VTKSYQPLGLEGLVITRCDETTAFGAIASTAVEAGIGIAYSTHADGVSIAPRGGDNLMLARAVMAGQWPEPPVAMPGVRRARAGSRAG